jgi:hypothetical protein
MAFGAVCLAVSVLLFRFTNAELLAWVLLTLALPPVIDGAGWNQAELLAGWRCNLDPDSLRGAYKVRNAVPRLALLYVWLFGILAARELNLLPDDGWTVVIIFTPLVVWAALAYRSHSKIISGRLAEHRSSRVMQ